MRTGNVKGFKGGWIIGDFDQSFIPGNKDFEVAVKRYKKDDVEPAHVHMIATEVTVVISGMVMLGDLLLCQDDFVVLEPGEPMSGDWRVLHDAVTVCIKFPSCPGDKYPLNPVAEVEKTLKDLKVREAHLLDGKVVRCPPQGGVQ